MGELLAYGALVRSGAFFRYSESSQKHVIEKILSFRSKQERFSLAASVFFTDIIEQVDEDTFSKLVWPKLKQEIVVPWLDQNLDTLYLIFIAKRRFPDVINACSSIKILNNSELFSADNMKYLCTKLLDVSSYDQLNHPVYSVVSNEIANSVVLIYFVYQLDHCLEEQSLNKLVAVSVILTNIIRALDDLSLLTELLQYNFMLQLQHHFRTPNTSDPDYPKAVARVNEFFETLLTVFRNSYILDQYKVALLKKLLLYPGDLLIDNYFDVKIVRGMTSILHTEGVKELSNLYKKIVTENIKKENKAKVDSPWTLDEKRHASNAFVQLLAHPAVSEEFDWRTEQMRFLIHRGFIDDNSVENIDPQLSDFLRELFYTSLNLKLPNLEQQRSTFSAIFKYVKVLTYQLDLNINLRIKLPPETLEMWKTVNEFINATEGKIKTNEPANLFFQTLILQMTLYLLTGEEMAIACLQEILLSYQKIKSKAQSAWVNEIVMDLLLVLLTYHSDFIQKSVYCMSGYLNEFVTYGTVRKLLPILDASYDNSPHYTEFNEQEFNIYDNENEIIKEAIKGNQFQKYRKYAQQVFETLKVSNTNVIGDNSTTKAMVILKEYAVTILDSYISTNCNLTACLNILATLINSLEATAKMNDCETLNGRLKNCFKTLTSLRKFNSFEGLTSTDLSNFLRALLDKANEENQFKHTTAEICKSCQFIIKCSTLINSTEAAPEPTKRKLNQKLTRTLTIALESFFNSKETSNVFSVFKSIFKQKWICVLYVVPNLYIYGFKPDIKMIKRILALELLTTFYNNHELLKVEKYRAEKFLQDDEVQFSDNIINFFKIQCLNSPQTKPNEKYITNIFRVLTSVINSPTKDDHFDWRSIRDYIRQYRGLTIFTRDAKCAYKELLGKLEPCSSVKDDNKQSLIDLDELNTIRVSKEDLITKLSCCSEKLNNIVLSLKESNHHEQKSNEKDEKGQQKTRKSRSDHGSSPHSGDLKVSKILRVKEKPGSSNIHDGKNKKTNNNNNGDYEYMSIIRKVHKANKGKREPMESRSRSRSNSEDISIVSFEYQEEKSQSKEKVKSGKRKASTEKIEDDKEALKIASNEITDNKTTRPEKDANSDENSMRELSTMSAECKSENLIQTNGLKRSKIKHEVFSKSCPTIDEEADVDLDKGKVTKNVEKLAPKKPSNFNSKDSSQTKIKRTNSPTTNTNPKENLTRKKAQTNMDESVKDDSAISNKGSKPKTKNKSIRNNNKIKSMIKNSNCMFENLIEAITAKSPSERRLLEQEKNTGPKKVGKSPQDLSLASNRASTNIFQDKMVAESQKKTKEKPTVSQKLVFLKTKSH
ncbi:uncharacterized protein LOC108732835 isoform X2 [Agrilus planipennis]|nr:uncharacterized protein LOC108732835 isoform X2 [Agrilus planipennis]